MTLKMLDVVSLYNTLKLVIDTENIDMDVLLKFKILGILKELDVHIENFNVIKNDNILKYGTVDENGGYMIPSDDKKAIQSFRKDIDKVLQSNVDVSIQKISINDILKMNLSSDILVKIYPILCE